jgi:hypothetical protein
MGHISPVAQYRLAASTLRSRYLPPTGRRRACTVAGLRRRLGPYQTIDTTSTITKAKEEAMSAAEIDALLRNVLLLSTANVTNGQSFDSGTTGIDVQKFRRLTGRIVADQAGTLKLFFSDVATGAFAATPDVSTATVAGTPLDFDSVAYGGFVRIQWANGGGSPTTSFRLVAYGEAEG